MCAGLSVKLLSTALLVHVEELVSYVMFLPSVSFSAVAYDVHILHTLHI